MGEVVGNPIEVIRSSLRAENADQRKSRRSDSLNKNRSALGQVAESIDIFSDPREIIDVATKLKHKNKVTLLDLNKLKNSFLVSEENIAAFLNVPGALHGLVREMSGHNSDFQYAALNCCCNLTLGSEKLCYQVSKATVSYITPSLNELNSLYLDVCLWTLGNLSGSGMKSWTVLESYGILNKFLHFLSSPVADVKESAIYATTLYVETGFDSLSASEFRMIADYSCELVGNEPCVYWLIFLLSCSSEANQVFLANMVTSSVFDLLINLVNTCKQPNPVHVTALVRTLSNLCGEDSKQGIGEIMVLLDIQSVDFLTAINVLLASPHQHIQRETLWLLGNMLKHCMEASDFVMSLEERLKTALSKANQG